MSSFSFVVIHILSYRNSKSDTGDPGFFLRKPDPRRYPCLDLFTFLYWPLTTYNFSHTTPPVPCLNPRPCSESRALYPTFDILFFNGLSSLHDNRQPINGSSASPMFLQLASNHVTHFSCKTEIMFINCKPCMTCNRCRQHSKGVLRKNKQRSHSLRTLFPTVRIRNPRLQENRHHSSDKNAI